MSRSIPLKVHVLYESSNGADPHGCSVIRLLRPLQHESVRGFISLSYSVAVPLHPVDVVIIERLWTHQLQMLELLRVLDGLRERGIKIVYETDDDLLNIHACVGDREWPSMQDKNIIRLLAREAHALIVSTARLAKVFAPLNDNVYIFENMLDESLFQRQPPQGQDGRIKFGYMGTFTHLADLIFISAAIKCMLYKYKEVVEFEIVGIGDEAVIYDVFPEGHVTIKRVPEQSVHYEKFCLWMQENIRWDFGIAPLLKSIFTDSKSDIKFLDYSIIGVPGIYSNVPAYAGTVKHKINGLLCDNDLDAWVLSLETMITSSLVRSTLADAAHDYVLTNRVLRHRATDLLTILRRVASESAVD